MGIAALILSIVGVVMGVWRGGNFGWIGLILAVTGGFLGLLAIKHDQRALGYSAVIVSGLGTLLGLVTQVRFILFIRGLGH